MVRSMDAPRILVPTDLSACSKRALEYGLFIMEKTGAAITLLHVVEPARYIAAGLGVELAGGVVQPVEQFSRRHFEEELNAFLEGFDRNALGLSVKTVEGIPHDAITRQAEDFDLIVMGTHGRSGFQHLVTGSVAGRVVRSAPCPVITVREEASKLEKKLKRILVAVDPGEWSKPALIAAKNIARPLGAEVEALYVWEPLPWLRAHLTVSRDVKMSPEEFEKHSQQEARRSLEEFVASVAVSGAVSGRDPDVAIRVQVGTPAETTVERAAVGQFDLVVIGTHGREGVTRMLLGSVAEKVIRACPIPVMTVPAE